MNNHIFKAASAPAPTGGLARIGDGDMGRALFLATLTHDDRGAFYVVCHRTAKDGDEEHGGWTEGRGVTADELKDERGQWWTETNAYVTVNGLSRRRRSSAALFQKNTLFFDIDVHEGDHGIAVPAVSSALHQAIDHGLVPMPTMITDTGRGLQLYYVLERSIPRWIKLGDGERSENARALGFAASLERALDSVLEACVCACVEGAKLDNSVHDYARVGRIPGTYNTKAGAYCRLVTCSGKLWSLGELSKRVTSPSPTKKPSDWVPALTPHATRAFLLRRMRALEKLVELRESGGGSGCCTNRCRNELVFTYCCAAVRVAGPTNARKLTHALNQRFRAPLRACEVESTIASVERRRYKLRNSRVVENLGITPDEAHSIGLTTSRREEERSAAKAATAAKRAKRNARIVELRGSGLTQAEVATEVGCSLRTVCTVLREAGMTRLRTSAARTAEPKLAVRTNIPMCKIMAKRQGVNPQRYLLPAAAKARDATKPRPERRRRCAKPALGPHATSRPCARQGAPHPIAPYGKTPRAFVLRGPPFPAPKPQRTRSRNEADSKGSLR